MLQGEAMQRDHTVAGAAALPAFRAHQPATDEVLVHSIARGDKSAMQVLFARHNVRVYRFVVRLVGEGATAEDVVSDVFLDVWRRADQFKGRCQVSTWLLAIARYKALSQMRRRTFEHLDGEEAQAVQDSADSPQGALEQKDRGALLHKALKQLSTIHREVIDLIYYHEKSIEEVAVILQVPRTTVRTRMFYARKRLAELLKADGVTNAFA
jgi:RNA polymerase sigma-70 factor (ECF subfamily)